MDNKTFQFSVDFPEDFGVLMEQTMRNQAWLMTIAELQTQMISLKTGVPSEEIWADAKEACGKHFTKILQQHQESKNTIKDALHEKLKR